MRTPAVRRGNPHFTNPAAIAAPVAAGSCFEKVVEDLHLSPRDYLTSVALRDWVYRNKDDKYVPSEVLEAFGFEVSTG